MFRKISVVDRPILEQWIKADPWHRDTTTTDFFYEKGKMTVCVEDEEGPVMYIKLTAEPPLMRLDIQFPEGHERRVARAFLKGYESFSKECQKAGAQGFIFDSVSPKLIRFCERAMGFQRVGESEDYRTYFQVAEVAHVH